MELNLNDVSFRFFFFFFLLIGGAVVGIFLFLSANGGGNKPISMSDNVGKLNFWILVKTVTYYFSYGINTFIRFHEH